MRIKKFNELTSNTYWSAANKLSDMGHTKRAERMKKWAALSGFYKKPTGEGETGFEDVDNFEFNCYIVKETWKNGKILSYKTTKKIVGKEKLDFHSFAWDMVIDNWVEDADSNHVFVHPCFLFEGDSVFPFAINMEGGKVKVETRGDFGETSLNDLMPFKTDKDRSGTVETREYGSMCFSNRKDAVRFLKIWKHPNTRKEFNEAFEDGDTNVDDLKEGLVKMFSLLKPNMLYKEE